MVSDEPNHNRESNEANPLRLQKLIHSLLYRPNYLNFIIHLFLHILFLNTLTDLTC